MFSLEGKIVVVTGGSMGIGLESARVCLESGARVLLCARAAGPLQSATEMLERENGPGRVASASCDVADLAQVQHAFASARERFGPIHAVIHAAAVLEPIGAHDEVDPEAWWRSVEINLRGSSNVIRTATRQFKLDGVQGRIAAFSGGGAATPFPNYTAYACGKVALVRLVESVAIEVAPFGIEINAVAPGFVATRMHQATLEAGEAAGNGYLERTRKDLAAGGVSPRLGASCAAYLISESARGITGKFVAAPYDKYQAWIADHQSELDSDIFTLRRIVPRDRGSDWQ